MPVTTLSRLLPYLLLTFIGIAGWTMQSTVLLAIVVIGTAAVAIGTSAGGRASSGKAQTPPEVQ